MARSNGQMDLSIRVIGLMMQFKVPEDIFGVMVEHFKDNGKIINFMEKAYSLGWTVEHTADHMKTMPKVVLEPTLGQMERSLKGNG